MSVIEVPERVNEALNALFGNADPKRMEEVFKERARGEYEFSDEYGAWPLKNGQPVSFADLIAAEPELVEELTRAYWEGPGKRAPKLARALNMEALR